MSGSGGDVKLTDDQLKKLRTIAAVRDADIETERRDVSRQVSKLCKKLDLAPADHLYLVTKGVKPHGALVSDKFLILPLVDINGQIWSAQGISPEPCAEFGGRNKSFERGGRISGCFFPIGPVTESEKVLVCEGFATGATLHEATGIPVACAMSAGNLKAVAAALRKKNPAAAVIICADNDRQTDGNPGVTKAEEAALSLQCGIVVPEFDVPPAGDATDFNDLARLKGMDHVRKLVMAVVPPDRPPLIYDAGRASWWVKVAGGDFILSSEAGARRQLKSNGFSAKQGKDDNISPLDAELVRLTQQDNVAYAGPVAGWPVGIHRMAGRRVLVTSTSAPMPRGPGDCTVLYGLLNAMLGEFQLSRLLLWLVCHRRRLQTGKWHPMPALTLVGPPSCGKSLLQHIITLLGGGRSAKPAQYLQGTTPFNGDLFGAEHLVFEDESAKADGVSRRHLGEQIKTMLFCRQVQCHGKHRQAITLEPLWALSMSINDEPEHLMVLPPIDESLADKILLLRCLKYPRPVPEGEEETAWLSKLVAAELPALADMLDRLSPEEFLPEFRNPRTIVAGWQNPVVMEMISSLAPEALLMSYIDETIFAVPIPMKWTGTAEQLTRALRAGVYGNESARLLSWPAACGVYLSRLAHKTGSRVARIESRTRTDGQVRKWTIAPPSA